MPRKSKAELESPRLVDDDFVVEGPLPPPPAHLSAAAQAWWVEITSEFILRPHHLKILELAADAWDRTVAARELLRRDGLISSTAAGDPKGHPAAVIERDSRAAFMLALRELDLDSEPKPSDRRPPPLYSNRR
jgi:P27 family predicted phage terminase small subunit